MRKLIILLACFLLLGAVNNEVNEVKTADEVKIKRLEDEIEVSRKQVKTKKVTTDEVTTDKITFSSNVSGVPDSNTLYNDGVVKGWITFNMATASTFASYNVSSIVDNNVGIFTINWNKDFASSSYVVVVTGATSDGLILTISDRAAGYVQIRSINLAGNATDCTITNVIAIGLQ